MKKYITLLISFLLIFSLVSCEFPSLSLKPSDEIKDTASESDNPNLSNDEIEEPFQTNEFTDYFSTKVGETLTLSQGGDKLDELYSTQYIGNNKIQILSVSGKRYQNLYEFTSDGVYLIESKEMKDAETPVNLILNKDENNSKELIIKAPLETGTKWTDSKGNSLEITGVDKTCITKSGEYKALEITITGSDKNTITKNYYGKNLGLIKSVTRDDKNNIISLKQLSKVD